MESAEIVGPALTIAIALAVGMLAQVVARHLRVPGIVLLCAAGVVLSPDVLGVLEPASLDGALQALVGFAVAIILFEGGLNLNARSLRRQARSIQGLVTVGALVTAAGGALAARLILGWDWTQSILFGTLVIVTGPTVVTPLLRRIRVHHRVSTVLEAEGVLIDPIGAVVAVVALEVAISPSGGALAAGVGDVMLRLGTGLVVGVGGGLLIALLLRIDRLVPEGLENTLTLAMAVALFQLSNALVHESGIMTVTVAGLVVGNVHTRALHDLKEFKEQLTVLMIGMLFVLLSADIGLEDVLKLGLPGVATVLVLMLVVRPLNVLAGTWGSDLGWREKALLSWMAPRGIVAAAVSSLFAQSLDAAGIPGGESLRALVFLVIGMTVVLQGLTGGLVARGLGLRRPASNGYGVLGANDLARALGRALRDGGEDVVVVDNNPDACQAAIDDGFRVVFGSALSERSLHQMDLEGRAGCVALTANDELNLLFARKAREQARVPKAWVALRRGHMSVTPEMVDDIGGRILFAEPRTVDLWMLRLERGLARVECWRRLDVEPPEEDDEDEPEERYPENVLLPIARRRQDTVVPMDETLTFREDDLLTVVVFREREDEAEAWRREHGWASAGSPS